MRGKDRKYERDAIVRFVEIATSWPYKTPDDVAIKEAAEFLLSAIRDVQAGRDIKPSFTAIGIKKDRHAIFKPASATVDSIEFETVRKYAKGDISFVEAKAIFFEIHPASDRQIENWIAEIKKRAESTNNFFNWMDENAKIIPRKKRHPK